MSKTNLLTDKQEHHDKIARFYSGGLINVVDHPPFGAKYNAMKRRGKGSGESNC